MLALDELFTAGLLGHGSVFERTPEDVALDDLRHNRRVEGMLAGLAVGDALGLPTEYGYNPARRQEEHGRIGEHEHNPAGLRGSCSDDTQMSLWTLERLLALGLFEFDDLARYFVDRHRHLGIVGIGTNVRDALANHARRFETGCPAALNCSGDPRSSGRGNGALMRYAPLLLPHLRAPSPRLWTDLILSAFITHSHAAALSSVAAFGHLLWEVLRRPCGSVPGPEWWLDRYVEAAAGLETDPLPAGLGYEQARHVPRLYRGFEGTLCEFVDTVVRAAWRSHMPLAEACSLNGFNSRNDTLQTVPAALYVLMTHAGDLEKAVVAAVNDTDDNDTVASIVGAILGALHGRDAVPQRWLDGIKSRAVTGTEPDRVVVERLAADAVARFL